MRGSPWCRSGSARGRSMPTATGLGPAPPRKGAQPGLPSRRGGGARGPPPPPPPGALRGCPGLRPRGRGRAPPGPRRRRRGGGRGRVVPVPLGEDHDRTVRPFGEGGLGRGTEIAFGLERRRSVRGREPQNGGGRDGHDRPVVRDDGGRETPASVGSLDVDVRVRPLDLERSLRAVAQSAVSIVALELGPIGERGQGSSQQYADRRDREGERAAVAAEGMGAAQSARHPSRSGYADRRAARTITNQRPR